MKNKFQFLITLVFLAGLILAACSPAGPEPAETTPVVRTIYIGPTLVDCTGEGQQKCMLVKENPEDEYTFFYDQIESFDYEEGYEYVIRIKEERIENPPAGGSSIKWILVEEVSKTEAPPTATEIPANVAVADLESIRWRLISYVNIKGSPTSVLPGTEITAEFREGQVNGNAGCNQYFGAYETDGDNLFISNIGMTEMFCSTPTGVMDQENEYLTNLQSAASYRITDDRLQAINASGQTVLTFAAVESAQLAGTTWQLSAYYAATDAMISTLAGTQVTAAFGQDGNLTGLAGCNNYNATYEVEGSAIRIGPTATTRMFCSEPEGIMEQETAYLAALESAASYTIQGDTLELINANGTRVLAFQATASVDNPASIVGKTSGSLSIESLMNSKYMSDWTATGWAELVDGNFREPAAPDSASETIVSLSEHVAYGQLGDGQEAAAVIMITTTGGSGTFYDLAAMVESDGEPINVALIPLGDRIKINHLTIENSEIIVDMVIQGPNDPMCCPTQQIIQTYTLEGDELVQGPTEVVGTVESGTPSDLRPEDVTFDFQDLAESVEGHTSPSTPYDKSSPPGPTGASAHITFSFDGQERMFIFPIAEYQALWEAAGDNTITDIVNQLTILLADQTEAPEAPLPILPPLGAYNDLAAQVKYLDFNDGIGVRFIGRVSQDPGPVLNNQLNYYFQGLTNDGQYYLSLIYPLSTSALPDGVDALSTDVQKQAQENPEGYLQVTKGTLNALAPSDFTPDLSRLDAMVASVSIQMPETTETSPLPGTVWKWLHFQEMNDNLIVVDNPDRYTLEFLPDGTLRVQADCNTGSGTYTANGSQLSVQIMAMTMAACPTDSLSDAFIGYLNEAASYTLEGEYLYIALMLDTGIMLFAP